MRFCLHGSYNKPRPLGRGGPVRVSERGSLLAGLYGLAWLVRVSCTVVVGIGALVGGQSKIESESPLSVPLGHLSPKGETIFYMYALLVFVISEGDGFWILR